GIAPARQMHPARAAGDGGLDVVMHGNCRAAATAERDELGQQGMPLGGGKVLLAQAEPAAAPGKRRRRDLDQRQPRLRPVGNDEERRVGKRQDHPAAVSSRADRRSRFFSRPNSTSGAMRAPPASRQVPNFSNSSLSLSG